MQQEQFGEAEPAVDNRQTMTGKIVPLCLLITLAVAVAIVLVVYFSIESGHEELVLDLEQPGPFDRSDADQVAQILTANMAPSGLKFRMENGRLYDLSFRLSDSNPPFALTAREVQIVTLDETHWPPYYGDFRLHDFELRLEDPAFPPWLQTLEGDALLTYRLNPESGTLDLPQLMIQVPGLGLAEAAVSLDSIDPARPFAELERSAISTFSVTVEDEGLLRQSLAYIAQREGLSEETLRRNLSALATFLQSESGYPFLREFLQAMKRVVEHRGDGQVVSLSATPQESFPISRLSELSFSPLPKLSILQDLNLRFDAR
ncbi:MAG: hypothetical protein RIC87_09825 [Kiloniellales bacterium]